MNKTSDINSICLISNRIDVVKFCEQAVGSLAKVYTEKEVYLSTLKFSQIILLDISLLKIDDGYIALLKMQNIIQKIICLIPQNCPIEKKMFAYKHFSDLLPVPCTFQLLKSRIEKQNSKKQFVYSPYSLKNTYFTEKNNPIFGSFLGESKSMMSLKNHILTVANNDNPVLLLGETGTGKTTVAKIIHNLSERKRSSFISESIPNLPEALASSILFGNTEGAYTDAKKRQGLFKAANGGTLFLDEIGFASHNIQGLLLTVIESKIIRPVGSDNETPVDVRLFFATNSDLHAMRVNGTFREDFYQRISTYCLHLPPLRDHLSDLPKLAESFLQEYNKELHKYSLEKMMNYTWPGNIRELQNCIRRAATFCQNQVITPDYIELDY